MANTISFEMLDIIPVSKWNEHFPYPTVGAIRQLMCRNVNNFYNTVIRNIAGRKYICVSAFQKWIADTNK